MASLVEDMEKEHEQQILFWKNSVRMMPNYFESFCSNYIAEYSEP
jgi:hypothetical protein